MYHCYRLLLRRNPDPTGYRAYADKVADGITVEQLVGYFLGSPNVGYYTLLAARRMGSTGRVIAFEPNPTSLKVLLLNTLPEGDTIRVYPFAVSDREGFLSLMRIVSIASSKRVTEEELRYPSDVTLTGAPRRRLA